MTHRQLEEQFGGSAFPRNNSYGQAPGMSLRDWFAGQALPIIMAQTEAPNAIIAQAAYDMADAMLRERDRDAPV